MAISRWIDSYISRGVYQLRQDVQKQATEMQSQLNTLVKAQQGKSSLFYQIFSSKPQGPTKEQLEDSLKTLKNKDLSLTKQLGSLRIKKIAFAMLGAIAGLLATYGMVKYREFRAQLDKECLYRLDLCNHFKSARLLSQCTYKLIDLNHEWQLKRKEAAHAFKYHYLIQQLVAKKHPPAVNIPSDQCPDSTVTLNNALNTVLQNKWPAIKQGCDSAVPDLSHTASLSICDNSVSKECLNTRREGNTDLDQWIEKKKQDILQLPIHVEHCHRFKCYSKELLLAVEDLQTQTHQASWNLVQQYRNGSWPVPPGKPNNRIWENKADNYRRNYIYHFPNYFHTTTREQIALNHTESAPDFTRDHNPLGIPGFPETLSI